MKRRRLIAAIGLLALHAAQGQEVSARAALDRAIARQRIVPSYTEHLYGRLPVVPGAVDTVRDALTERLKERALDAAEDKIAAATAKVPFAGDAIAKARAQVDVAAPELAIAFGPEAEIATTEHAGKRQRQTALAGTMEIVRADGRMAMKVSPRPQILQMQLAVAASGYDAFEQARQVRSSIRSMGAQLAQGGIGKVASFVDAIGQIDALLGAARTTAQLAQATALMEQVSGSWQCEPDPLDAAQFGERIEVVQVADDTLAGTPAHVYREVRAFAVPQASMPAPVDPDDERPAAFQVRIQTWIGIADGLPLRSEFALPGGRSQRIDYDYGKVSSIEFPVCANPQ